MIKVTAQRLSLDQCRNECEREFLEALHDRAEQGSWYADGWLWDDRIVIAVCPCDRDPAYNCVLRTLRVDFDGQRVAFGPDETHQFVTDLDPSRPDVTVIADRPSAELADIAADWLEREMRRVIVRNEWNRLRYTRRAWMLADTGEGLGFSDSGNKGKRPELGPPDRSIKVWPW